MKIKVDYYLFYDDFLIFLLNQAFISLLSSTCIVRSRYLNDLLFVNVNISLTEEILCGFNHIFHKIKIVVCHFRRQMNVTDMLNTLHKLKRIVIWY